MKPVDVDQEIIVQSSQVRVSDALVEDARTKIKDLVAKVFGRITSCTVHFKREGSFYECSINLKVGALNPFIAHATHTTHTDCHGALHETVKKLGHQMQRRKNELRSTGAQRVEKTLQNNGDHGPRSRTTSVPQRTYVPQPRRTLHRTDYDHAERQRDQQNREAAVHQNNVPLRVAAE